MSKRRKNRQDAFENNPVQAQVPPWAILHKPTYDSDFVGLSAEDWRA